MTLSEELLQDWQKYSIESLGEIFPINYIGMSDDIDGEGAENILQIGYEVPICDPPLKTKDDKIVRLVLVTYDIQNLVYEQKH